MPAFDIEQPHSFLLHFIFIFLSLLVSLLLLGFLPEFILGFR
jgi:hypothetical protein